MQPLLVKPAISKQQAAVKARVLDLPYDEIFEVIRKHEGFKPKPYRDSKQKWTIGIGTLIGDGSDSALAKSPYKNATLSRQQAEQIAREDMMRKAELAASDGQLGEVFSELSPRLKAQVISGYYRGDVSGSPKTKKLIRERKFAEAASEFLDNEEYREAKRSGSGVGPRMEEIAKALRDEAARSTFTGAVEARLSR
jgi:GH24 family phage-related lysozyme (muramidase)